MYVSVDLTRKSNIFFVMDEISNALQCKKHTRMLLKLLTEGF